MSTTSRSAAALTNRGSARRKRGISARGQVVDAEPADVLQGPRPRGLPEAGEAGDDEEPRLGRRSPGAAAAPLLLRHAPSLRRPPGGGPRATLRTRASGSSARSSRPPAPRNGARHHNPGLEQPGFAPPPPPVWRGCRPGSTGIRTRASLRPARVALSPAGRAVVFAPRFPALQAHDEAPLSSTGARKRRRRGP